MAVFPDSKVRSVINTSRVVFHIVQLMFFPSAVPMIREAGSVVFEVSGWTLAVRAYVFPESVIKTSGCRLLSLINLRSIQGQAVSPTTPANVKLCRY